MSSSIKRNRRSVALTAAERKRCEREKQRKNQTDHDASNAEAQQQRPIPLSGAERIRRHRATKRQIQSNDAEAQNRSFPLSIRGPIHTGSTLALTNFTYIDEISTFLHDFVTYIFKFQILSQISGKLV
jgi:hypothetical protein